MNRIIAQIFASLVSLRHQAFALPVKPGPGSTPACDIIFANPDETLACRELSLASRGGLS